MEITDGFPGKIWMDYELRDAGAGEKLERWGKFILRRPDTQAIWKRTLSDSEWDNADASYLRDKKGAGHWEFRTDVPKEWNIRYGDLNFKIKPTSYKHTGIFPEQSANWERVKNIFQRTYPKRVLNLFAYTGALTCVMADAGAEEIVHLDASPKTVNWAQENVKLCGLEKHKIRFLVDDAMKFIKREARRGNKYDAIVMDPPSYGRGPDGELWKLEISLQDLVTASSGILSEEPVLFLMNCYTAEYSHFALRNLLQCSLGALGGDIVSGELGIPFGEIGFVLPAGIYAMWSR